MRHSVDVAIVIVDAPWNRRTFTNGFADEMPDGFGGVGAGVGGSGCGLGGDGVVCGGVDGASTGGGGGSIGRGAAQDASVSSASEIASDLGRINY